MISSVKAIKINSYSYRETKLDKARKIPLIEVFPGKMKLLGDKYMACCPIHKEENPSFAYYPKTNTWNCFAGCGGGDVVEFLEKLYKISFQEALERLVR